MHFIPLSVKSRKWQHLLGGFMKRGNNVNKIKATVLKAPENGVLKDTASDYSDTALLLVSQYQKQKHKNRTETAEG